MQRILSTMISERMKPRRYMMIREDDYEALDDALEDNMHAKESVSYTHLTLPTKA